MTSENQEKFVVLVILDGWGIAPPGPANAISLANTVAMKRFQASYPHTQLEASGTAVGLPRGEDGNTETGHLNLGAGRIVYQDLERINMAIAEGTFFENKILLGAIEHVKKNNSNLHYLGLLGAGGVHSNIEHLFALIQLAKRHGVENLYLHLFTDGRDSPPTSAQAYIDKVNNLVKREGVGMIASIMGRYWAMDRDQRWDRTGRAYFALTAGRANLIKSAGEAIKKSYSSGRTDEFIDPYLITDESGKPLTKISDNDAVVFFNFRIDRPRQLTKAFVLKDFKKAQEYFNSDEPGYRYSQINQEEAKKTVFMERGKQLKNLYFVTMTEYSKPLAQEGARPAFPPEQLENTLGAVLSVSKIEQLRITESEKERFVTFYFNGLRETPFPGEDRIIIPSPKVPTYDQKPEMSSKELTDKLLEQLKRMRYKFVLVNYPNPDIVGHTGNIGPAVRAIEAIDECVDRISNFVLAYNGILLITADHGNAEEMINPHTGEIDTEHSLNPVPFIAVSRKLLGRSQTLRMGILADIAPTVLNLLDIPMPEEMTGRDLLHDIWNH